MLNLHRRHLTREQRREAVEKLRAAGKTVREVAEALGVSVGTVSQDCPVFKNEQPGHLEQRREVVRDLRESGKSVREIAAELDVPKSTVADDLKAPPAPPPVAPMDPPPPPRPALVSCPRRIGSGHGDKNG